MLVRKIDFGVLILNRYVLDRMDEVTLERIWKQMPLLEYMRIGPLTGRLVFKCPKFFIYRLHEKYTEI